ncbi:MAG: sugar phosphate isomerase/epimerase [Gemmatimonadaceae bacterium]
MTTRRQFLFDVAALGATGSLLAGCASHAAGPGMSNASPSGRSFANKPTVDGIGLQLYTIGDQTRTNFDGALERVAQIGYKRVEFAGYGNKTPEQMRALLDKLHLKAPSTHIGLDLLRKDLEAQMHIAEVIGHEYITIPSLGRTEGDMKTADAWKRVADECNTIGAKLKPRKIQLAFHSHTAEYVDVGGGKTGMDVFITNTDPSLFTFQMDLGWARVAKQNPVEWFNKYPGRFRMWHIKDMNLAKGQPVPVGAGDIDFKPMLAAWKQSGMQYFFIEQDGAAQWPGGSMKSIETSYNALKKLLT